ncbi:hypothetical protein MHBO_004672 [Bonamia ostreae]|uniref:UspA domain-containing protein n=1 Tax=Bonamia ostreae TaxID=126728 RepID=A0ABV2ATZ5_9EUKA
MTINAADNVKINNLQIPKELQNRRRILITVDNSTYSAKALSFAKEHILRKNDFVILLLALKKLVFPYLITAESIRTLEDEELNKEAFALSNEVDQFGEVF